MEDMKDLIDSAMNKKYTKFSDGVHAILKIKMSEHPVTTNYVAEYDKIQSLKSSFLAINQEN